MGPVQLLRLQLHQLPQPAPATTIAITTNLSNHTATPDTTTTTEQEPPSLQQCNRPQCPPSNANPTHITITTYNVVSARKTRLLQALRVMQDLNTDIAILTETKLCLGRHAKQGHGYSILATSATSPNQGGVALVWRTKPAHWTLDGMCVLSANLVSAVLVSREQQWLLLGTYLSPNLEPDAELNALEMEASRHPHTPVIIMGDLNTDLDDINNARSIAIATTMQHLGATDCFH